MTANKDLKGIIRSRMSRTGESYMAARRHFRDSKDSHMIMQVTQTDTAILDLPIDELALKLKTARTLRGQGIERIGQLVERTAAGWPNSGWSKRAPSR